MSEHSKIGASSCEMWWNCPGSIALNNQLPQQEDSKYSAEGTAAHELCELGLKKGMKAVEQMEGEIVEIGDFEIKVTEEMIDAVTVYCEYIMEDLLALGLSKDDLLIEEKFHLTHIDKDAYGRNDACIYEPFGILKVYDFKYGAGIPVSAVKNKQLMYYASGAMIGKDASEIELVVIQPRIKYTEDKGISTYRMSVDELRSFEKELKVRIADTRKPDAKLSTGKGCRWCQAKKHTTCSEIKKTVKETLKSDFDGVPIPASTLSIDEMIKVVKNEKIILEFIKNAKDRLYNMAVEGSNIPEHKLVKKKANRIWSDEDAVKAEFTDLLPEELYDLKLKSPAKLEKILGKEVVAEFITIPDTGLTLVHESDRRKEVIKSPADDFI